MGFKEDLRRIARSVREREAQWEEGCAQAAYDSIRDGSPITGAPGQPVDTGELYNSWEMRKDGPHEWTIESKAPHAGFVEENSRGVTFKNHGPHSVKLTRLGWRRLAADVARNLGGTAGAVRPRLVRNQQTRDARGRFSHRSFGLVAVVRIRGR